MAKRTAPIVVSYDGGNWGIKAVVGAATPGLNGAGRVLIRHAMTPISETDFQRAADGARRGQAASNILRINGAPYAFGDAALRHTFAMKNGAARYRKGYADLLMCAAAFGLIGGRPGAVEVELLASHAPRDFQFADRLADALTGEYVIESPSGDVLKMRASVGMTLDEGLGALFNHLLLPNLKARVGTPVKAGSTVVMDIGGFTADLIPIDVENGQPVIDTTALASATIGTWALYSGLEDHLRTTYADLFQQQAQGLSFLLLDTALKTGQYKAGRHALDVGAWVAGEMAYMVNTISDTANREMGGLLNYQTILLAGGGAALLYPHLQAAFAGTHEIVLSEDQPDAMPFANAQGTMKLYQRMVATGVV